HHPITTNGANPELYFGYRSLGLDEKLQFHSASTPSQADLITFPDNRVLANETVAITDFFGTSNRFYGPQVGGGFNWQLGRLGANLTGKVAAGINHQSVTINGDSTLLKAGGDVFTVPGGVLALG